MTKSEARDHGRRIRRLVDLAHGDFMDECFGVFVGVNPHGETVEDGSIRCRVPYYKIDRRQGTYGPNQEFRVWPGEKKNGQWDEDSVLEYTRRYRDQEYCRICTNDLSGVHTTMDIPIIGSLFLDDHRCLNWDEADVKLRPLCYNSACVRKEHWVIEGQEYYNSRNSCPATSTTCKHQPPCCIPGKGFWMENIIAD